MAVRAEPALASNSEPLLSLPWAPGESWTLLSGCHTWSGGTGCSSLDFTTASGSVRAAASGTVHRDGGCASAFVRIDHGNGWNTSYYHLTNIPSSLTDGSCVSRGALLGTVGQAIPCGGDTGGTDHVHMTLWKFTGTFSFSSSQEASWVDMNIGGFTVTWDGTYRHGCLHHIATGVDKCVSNLLYNDGSIGGVGQRLLGDVNGDTQHKVDAVVMFKDSGTAMVALSTGSSFGTPVAWSAEPAMSNATRYFLGDVNGDGKADLVGFWNNGGVWKVMLSSGSGFWGPPVTWAIGQGGNTAMQWVADVNGDGKADTMTFDSVSGPGDWYASLSTGTGFGPNQQLWSHGNGVGNSDQFVADFTGDGKADVGVYFKVNGKWYVTVSGTTPPPGGFGSTQWSAGHPCVSPCSSQIAADQRVAGDVSGDGKADAAYFRNTTPGDNWWVGTSSGSGFWTPTAWAAGQGIATTERFLADVSGDGMADMITFDVAAGDWWVSTSSGSGFWTPSQWRSGHGAGS